MRRGGLALLIGGAGAFVLDGGTKLADRPGYGVDAQARDDAEAQQTSRRLTTVSADDGSSCVDTDTDITDVWWNGCSDYDIYPSWCGNYDDTDFSAEDVCCECGGGDTASSGSSPAPASSGSPAPLSNCWEESCGKGCTETICETSAPSASPTASPVPTPEPTSSAAPTILTPTPDPTGLMPTPTPTTSTPTATPQPSVGGIKSFTELEEAITDGAVINIATSSISVITELTIPNSDTVVVTSDDFATMSGAGNSRMFKVYGDLTLRSLRLVNGAVLTSDCGETSPCSGGAIYVANSGVLTMDSCVVRNSLAYVSGCQPVVLLLTQITSCFHSARAVERSTSSAASTCRRPHLRGTLLTGG